MFRDLAIWMVGFGLLIGIVFPFFMILLGVPATIVLTPMFITACLVAGAFVASVNYSLSHCIVGGRLRVLADGMNHVEQHLSEITVSGDFSRCTPDSCMIPSIPKMGSERAPLRSTGSSSRYRHR